MHSLSCPAHANSIHSRGSTCSRASVVSCRAAGSTTAPGVSLKRFADAQPAAVVTERRAADVAVLGNSTAAVLAAYTLAKSGRKVLLLPDFGLAAPAPRPRPLHPLKLTDPDPLQLHLAAESAAYWGGLQLTCGAALLVPQQSLDVVLDPEADHPGALGFSKLQEACAAVGVSSSLLSGSEVNNSFRQLQLPPHRSAALLQPDGGVLRARQAAAAARQLAANAGVMIRDGLVLSGWRDRGSAFELRASSRLSPADLTCLYEAEVLLLAPHCWATHCSALLGLTLQGLEAREILCSQSAVNNAEQLQQLPLLHSWGAAAASDAPQQPEGFTLLPPAAATADGRVSVQQGAPWGVPVTSPFTWQQVVRTSAATQQQQEEGEGQQQQGQQEQQRQPGASAPSGGSWVDLQVQQLHTSCSALLRGLAPRQHPTYSSSNSVVNTTPDGRPVLGSHPGFDQGRVVLCCGATGRRPFGPGSSSSSYQFSPMLAKLAADLVKSGGSSSGSSNVAILLGISLQRDAVNASSSLDQLDAWEGLGRLQQQQSVSDVELEEQQDLARDAEQDLVGTQQ